MKRQKWFDDSCTSEKDKVSKLQSILTLEFT
jgi:hypothetical protein